jgi:hypothetical protein
MYFLYEYRISKPVEITIRRLRLEGEKKEGMNQFRL